MISLNMIIGPFEEPFLMAALDSVVDLCDEFIIVDTAPGNNPNIQTVMDWFAKHIWEIADEQLVVIEMPRGEDKDFSFAAARDLARINSSHEWCLRLDADEVIHEKDISYLRQFIKETNASGVEVAFYHHMVYPCLYQYIEPKTLFFRTNLSCWTRGVHELLQIDGPIKKLYSIKYNHYGYCRGQKEVFKRWKLYTDIDNKPNWYNGYDAENILTDRISVCHKYDTTHPKFVIAKLVELFGEEYDVCPFDEIKIQVGFDLEPHMVGLLYICYNDDNDAALNSLLETINVPTVIYIADMNSEQKYVDQINSFRVKAQKHRNIKEVIYDRYHRLQSLSSTMNKAFKYFIGRTDVRFIGWFHPDMVAEKFWLSNLLLGLSTYNKVGKLSAYNTKINNKAETELPYDGHEQAYLIPKSVLQEIGLFDEQFLGIGGYEDWDLNRRMLLNGYSVMIFPQSRVFHTGMTNRKERDCTFHAHMNMEHYRKKWNTDKER